jgi:hypothetical protein
LSETREARLRCRQITRSDIGAVVDLLTRGFPERSRGYWEKGLERQGARAVPEGYPIYGYLLESDKVVVGVVLLLFSSFDTDAGTKTRCNLSSWYVEPAFRAHGSLLITVALRHKEVTYLNISPAKHTWSTVEAQGLKRYSAGQFLALAALGPKVSGAKLHHIRPNGPAPAKTDLPEAELLAAHAGLGCISIVCTAPDGAFPFIFRSFRPKKGLMRFPCAQLIYCRDIKDFVRFSGPLGRFLLRRGLPVVALDANEPIAALTGSYRESWGPKFYRGSEAPRLGDLAFTELVIFGP